MGGREAKKEAGPKVPEEEEVVVEVEVKLDEAERAIEEGKVGAASKPRSLGL